MEILNLKNLIEERNISNWPSTIDIKKENDNKNYGLIF